ncbi:MAG: alpha/beta fold hydrolase [Candidatus Omnitrophica bacterium]|nr:alpha/beta fold hydrolase [Candidatus Omnitrophota bacterium]
MAFEMKGIYITLIVIGLLTAILIIAAFIYLDFQRHQIFLYALYRDDILIGHEKVDKYRLENSLIFKSSSELPLEALRTNIARKATFDMRGKNLLDYTREVSANGAESTVNILNGPEKVIYMATGHANFSYLDSVPSYGNDLIFENEAVMTYAPLVKRYNFKKREEQFVNVLTPVSTFLPPVRNVISMTSVGRDILEIDGRKIGCERLILESRNGDLISVWVAGRFHNVLKVDMPKRGFKAVFSTDKKHIPVEEYKKKSELYTEKEAVFGSEEIALAGTLSVPTEKKIPYPAVLLIWDSGPLDREARGMFTDLAHTLAESGYCVLRFDKRGIGQSQGLFSTYAQPELISDLKKAIEYLKSLPEVDKSRIALLGHSEGGFYAAYLSGQDSDIRACVIMSALSSLNPLDNDCRKLKLFIKNIAPDDKIYLESAVASLMQSRDMIWGKGDWKNVLGYKVFTKKMNLEDTYSVTDAIKKVRVPTLILHGKKDEVNIKEEVEEIGDALSEGGNDNFTSIYFGKLDHFFGVMVKEPPVRNHIELDPEVSDSIVTWLNKNLAPLPLEPAATVPLAPEETGPEASPGPPVEAIPLQI